MVKLKLKPQCKTILDSGGGRTPMNCVILELCILRDARIVRLLRVGCDPFELAQFRTDQFGLKRGENGAEIQDTAKYSL